MYGIFTYIWLIFMINVGKSTIHGSYGILLMAIRNPAVRKPVEGKVVEIPLFTGFLQAFQEVGNGIYCTAFHQTQREFQERIGINNVIFC